MLQHHTMQFYIIYIFFFFLHTHTHTDIYIKLLLSKINNHPCLSLFPLRIDIARDTIIAIGWDASCRRKALKGVPETRKTWRGEKADNVALGEAYGDLARVHFRSSRSSSFDGFPDWEAALKGTDARYLCKHDGALWKTDHGSWRHTVDPVRATTDRLSGGFISLSGGREGDPIYLERAWIRCTRVCRESSRCRARRGKKAQNYPTPRERERERGGGEGWDVSLALCCYAREIIPPEARGVSDSRSLNVLMHSSFCSPLRNTLCFYVRRCSSRAEIYSSAHPPIGWLTSDPQFLSVTEKHPLSLLIS